MDVAHNLHGCFELEQWRLFEKEFSRARADGGDFGILQTHILCALTGIAGVQESLDVVVHIIIFNVIHEHRARRRTTVRTGHEVVTLDIVDGVWFFD